MEPRRSESGNNPIPVIKRNPERRMRAQGHVNTHIEATENIKILEKEKDSEAIRLIKAALKKHFVFTALDEAQIDNVLGKFFYCTTMKDQLLFKQGEEANYFFIVEQGKLQVSINDKEKGVLGPGTTFGELALLYNAPRSATLKALEDCFFWGIDGKAFRSLVEEMTIKDLEENKKFIEKIHLFSNLTSEQKENIAGILIKENYVPGAPIVNEGDNADSYYIIKKGVVSVLKGDVEVRTLKEEATFGEAALLETNNVRQMTIKAQTDVVCLSLGRDTLISILGDKVQNIASRNIVKWAFEKDPVLSKLHQSKKDKIIEAVHSSFAKPDTPIIKKGDNINKLVIPIDGNLIEASTRNVSCEKGTVLGSQYLVDRDEETKAVDDIVLENEGNYCEISIAELESLIGESLETMLQGDGLQDEAEQKEIETPLADLICLKKIGQGQFGNVYLVEDDQKNGYALKTISKARVYSLCLEKHIQDERRVLKILRSPFIMKFFRTYKDDKNVYFLTEYIRGMELFDVIREIGLLTKPEAQFYVGSVLLAVEYLHRQKIIYRDVKPENIMVDCTGYPKLIDMGTCKTLGKPGFRTFTVIGTPTYMAPEVVSGRGYSFAVDYWSIGVCLYEFICGYVPFGESCEDPFDIYNEILTKQLEFPHYMKDSEAKRLLQQMLNKMPEVRANGGFQAIKSHKWFSPPTFDWDKLFQKKLQPPYIPPADKLMSEEDLEAARAEKLNVVSVLQREAEEEGCEEMPQGGENPEDKNWDDEF